MNEHDKLTYLTLLISIWECDNCLVLVLLCKCPVFDFSLSVAFFISSSICLQFSSWARLNILTKLHKVDITAVWFKGEKLDQHDTERSHPDCCCLINHSPFNISCTFFLLIMNKYLVQRGSELDLLQNKESKNLHFYPANYQVPHKQQLNPTKGSKYEHAVRSSTYHARVQWSQSSHFSFSKTEELL